MFLIGFNELTTFELFLQYGRSALKKSVIEAKHKTASHRSQERSLRILSLIIYDSWIKRIGF